MRYSSEDWPKLLFRKAKNLHPSELNLDRHLNNVYWWAVDGRRTVGEIAQKHKYDLENLIDYMKQLIELGLIIPASAEKNDSRSIFELLCGLLSDQIGPMGEFILEEAIAELGYDIENCSSRKVHRLVNELALRIGDPEEGERFKKNALHELKQDSSD